MVANIPFNISTDVVKQLLPMGDIFSEVVLLLQVCNMNRALAPEVAILCEGLLSVFAEEMSEVFLVQFPVGSFNVYSINWLSFYFVFISSATHLKY